MMALQASLREVRTMAVPWRDSIATLLVAVGAVLYGGWVTGVTISGFDSVAAVAIAILVLGVAASASAVVPGFRELLRGSRLYLAGTSVLGLVALGGALYAIATDEPIALAALVLATVVLWAVSTTRHVGMHHPQQRFGHL
jgi:hypothetical protein